MRLAFLTILLLASCNPEPVGRRCDLGTEPAEYETVISSQSLDCTSRLCLQQAGDANALCTAQCDSDDDCLGDPSTPCTTGFACEIVAEVGPYAGESMCVCR
jgi:hypothetical protein